MTDSAGPVRVTIRPEAEADVADAAVWYHRQRPGLGDAFLIAIEIAITRAAANPFGFPVLRRRPEVRRVLTEKFPYRVFFVRSADRIVIFRVLHNARSDREWKGSGLPPS